MKGDPKVIDYLNKGLRQRADRDQPVLAALPHPRQLGPEESGQEVEGKESIEEMDHADKFAHRILFLDGFPNMQVLDPLRIGQDVKEILDCRSQAAEVDARSAV
jgi:bacterioferritin